MGFYRNVDQRMWGDRKFLSLSAPTPNAQTLWVYLLTGPHVGPVPGLSCVGRAGLAEALGWDAGEFDLCFSELEAAGMARADWKARVLWLPNALRHNSPDSPNHVKGWALYLDSLPDSPLTDDALRDIAKHCAEKGAAFSEALSKPSGKPYPKPYHKPSTKGSVDGSGSPTPSPIEAGEGEGKEEESKRSAEETSGADAPAPPVAGGKGKRAKRERVLPPLVAGVRAALGGNWPDASFDELVRRLDAGDLTDEQAVQIARWSRTSEFWRATGPSTLYRPKHWPDLLGKSHASSAGVGVYGVDIPPLVKHEGDTDPNDPRWR